MRKVILLPIVAVLALAGFLVYSRGDSEESSAQAAGSGQSQPARAVAAAARFARRCPSSSPSSNGRR